MPIAFSMVENGKEQATVAAGSETQAHATKAGLLAETIKATGEAIRKLKQLEI